MYRKTFILILKEIKYEKYIKLINFNEIKIIKAIIKTYRRALLNLIIKIKKFIITKIVNNFVNKFRDKTNKNVIRNNVNNTRAKGKNGNLRPKRF